MLLTAWITMNLRADASFVSSLSILSKNVELSVSIRCTEYVKPSVNSVHLFLPQAYLQKLGLLILS